MNYTINIIGYKYKDINDFIEDLENFFDIQFDYKSKSYSICPMDDYFSFCEKNMEPIKYKSIEELVNECKLGKVFLKDVITEIDKTF